LPRSTVPEGHAFCAGVVFVVELGRPGKLSGGVCEVAPEGLVAGPGNPVCVGNGNPVELGSEVGFAAPAPPKAPVDAPTFPIPPPVPVVFEAPGRPVCVGAGNPVELGSEVGLAGAFEVPAAGLVLVENTGLGLCAAVAPGVWLDTAGGSVACPKAPADAPIAAAARSHR